MTRLITQVTAFYLTVCWSASLHAADIEYVTGQAFQEKLETQTSATLAGLSLRDVLSQWSAAYRINCFRDRRVDPEQQLELSESSGTLKELFRTLEVESQTGVSFAGNTVYLGPAFETRRLRTLILLRTADAQKQTRRKTSRFTSRQTLTWPELSDPREVIQNVAESGKLSVSNPEALEYDLWSAGTLPDVTVPEALSILLLGFDLTFEIAADGTSITLVPIPPMTELLVAQTYRLKSGETTEGWQSIAPAAEISENGRRITVSGLVEDHEAIRDLRNGTLKRPSTDIASLPLSQRLFTLSLQNVPAAAVLEELQKSGIRFVWDRRSFLAAGIDFQTHVRINVQEVKAEEFFEKLLGPIGITCDLSGVTVMLRPNK